MDNRWFLRLLPPAAMLVMLAGLVIGSRALRDMRTTAGHIGDKVERLQELQRIRDGKTASPAALSAFESLTTQQPPDLAALCDKLLPGLEVGFREAPPVDAGSAWLLRRAEVNIERVALRQLAEIIRRAESERPPWRVRECLIEADPEMPGHARVSLQFEALHKEDI